jgi:hypothetical protein
MDVSSVLWHVFCCGSGHGLKTSMVLMFDQVKEALLMSGRGETGRCYTKMSSDGGKPSDTYCATDEGRWVRTVRGFLENLRYGEVTLTVHDSKVVQVEQTQKVRL